MASGSLSSTITQSNASTPNPSATKDAKPPFHDPTNADIILRSCDNHDFYVYKLILSLASPVFKVMFGLPQPTQSKEDAIQNPALNHFDEKKHGLSVIYLSES